MEGTIGTGERGPYYGAYGEIDTIDDCKIRMNEECRAASTDMWVSH